MKIKAKYNSETGLVIGYYPDNLSYKNNTFDINEKTVDGSPYIDISEKEWEGNIGEQMAVEDGIYQLYIKSSEELIDEAKNNKCAEILTQRDIKILEDSTRYAEGIAADAIVEEMTDIDSINNFDANSAFS